MARLGARQPSKIGAISRAVCTSAEINGVIGLRGRITNPIRYVTSGSTIGIARIASGKPSVSASFAGMTLAQRPVFTCV